MPEDTQTDEGGNENRPIILLDNHMIQHFLGKDTAPHLEELLAEVEKVGAELAVSQIVVYESLKAIIFNEKKFNEVNEFFTKYLVRYAVNEEVLMEAARVHELYGSDENTKNRRAGISTEDIIIGTTAMLQGAYVMTCDANDFPIPFFKEVNRQYVYYEVKNMRKHLIIYLLQPDTKAIEAALNTVNPPKVDVAEVKKKAKAKKK